MLTIKEKSGLYSRNIESFVKEEKGKKTVDWENIEKLRKNEREGTYSEEFYRKILAYLARLNILSNKADGNFFLSGNGGFNLGPDYFFSQTFFTREEDVREYKRVRYNNTHYPVIIWKISVID